MSWVLPKSYETKFYKTKCARHLGWTLRGVCGLFCFVKWGFQDPWQIFSNFPIFTSFALVIGTFARHGYCKLRTNHSVFRPCTPHTPPPTPLVPQPTHSTPKVEALDQSLALGCTISPAGGRRRPQAVYWYPPIYSAESCSNHPMPVFWGSQPLPLAIWGFMYPLIAYITHIYASRVYKGHIAPTTWIQNSLWSITSVSWFSEGLCCKSPHQSSINPAPP